MCEKSGKVFLKYCRPPARSTPEKEDVSGGGSGYDVGGRSGLGAAVLWRIEAMNEISRGLYRAVALAAGLPLPGQRSREELMLKCKEWLRIWGLRQLHSNMASAVRRGAANTHNLWACPLRSLAIEHCHVLGALGVLSLLNGARFPRSLPA